MICIHHDLQFDPHLCPPELADIYTPPESPKKVSTTDVSIISGNARQAMMVDMGDMHSQVYLFQIVVEPLSDLDRSI